MIFVDTNVLTYAVGREHPLRVDAQSFVEAALN
jgi:predicted nucleic acid-binding protein